MITVCIATYNGERYIRQQIESILSQLSDNDEVVVSDDGSTDNTLQKISNIGDKRIKIVEGPHRHSPTLNFENAMQHAKGNYIFLADQDDVWMPNKVEVCMKTLCKYDCVVSDAIVTDCKLTPIVQSLYNMMHIQRGKLYNLLWHNGYTGCCMAFKRSVLDLSLPFPKSTPMHDIWIGNVAAFCLSITFISDKLVLFRRHENTMSCNGKGSKYTTAQKLRFRWNVIKEITLLKTKIIKRKICR